MQKRKKTTHTDLKRASKAVILARVSSKEQEEGHSIEAQKHRLETYCQRNNLQILKVFELVESPP
jgi:DNA invertase Pin-like site-specific DNA recombinase